MFGREDHSGISRPTHKNFVSSSVFKQLHLECVLHFLCRCFMFFTLFYIQTLCVLCTDWHTPGKDKEVQSARSLWQIPNRKICVEIRCRSWCSVCSNFQGTLYPHNWALDGLTQGGVKFWVGLHKKVFWHKDEKRWQCSGASSALLSGETVENKLTPLGNHMISYHIISMHRRGITSWLRQVFCGCGGQELKSKYTGCFF